MASDRLRMPKTTDHTTKDSPLKDWFSDYWPNLAVPPYLGVVWVFTMYVGELATPWTIGYLILWLIFAPLATWTGVFIFAGAFRLSVACLVILAAAIPFWPDALWMFVTLLTSLMLGGSLYLWVPLAVFVAIVCAIYIWHTGGIGL